MRFQLHTLHVCCVFMALISLVAVACQHGDAAETGYVHKDLSEQMDAMAIYQGSFGDYVTTGKLEDGAWLLEGLDSVMLMVQQNLNNHSSLNKPFENYYRNKMEPPISALRKAIAQQDTATARRQYLVLVDKCNSCHREHGVLEKAHY